MQYILNYRYFDGLGGRSVGSNIRRMGRQLGAERATNELLTDFYLYFCFCLCCPDANGTVCGESGSATAVWNCDADRCPPALVPGIVTCLRVPCMFQMPSSVCRGELSATMKACQLGPPWKFLGMAQPMWSRSQRWSRCMH